MRGKEGGRDSRLNLKMERFGPSTSARFQIRRSPGECTGLVHKYIAGAFPRPRQPCAFLKSERCIIKRRRRCSALRIIRRNAADEKSRFSRFCRAASRKLRFRSPLILLPSLCYERRACNSKFLHQRFIPRIIGG